MAVSRDIARRGLVGCGDRSKPDWEDGTGSGRGIYHVQRLLSAEEREQYGIGEPRDIRGTEEERRITQVVMDEMPPETRGLYTLAMLRLGIGRPAS